MTRPSKKHAPQNETSQGTQGRTSIRVGGVPEHFNLPWHVGIESGDFDTSNLDVDFVTYHGGTGAMMQAVATREVDIAIVLTEGCIQSIHRGCPARIVKVFVDSPLIWGIHVAASSDLNHVDQIRKRRYAISRFGSGSHLMAIVDAASRGWETDLDFAVVKNLQGARDALAAGDADVFFWERYTTSPFVENGEFRRLEDRLTPWPAFVICVNQEFQKQKSHAVTTLLNQVNRICERLTQDGDATQQLIADRYQLNLKKVQQWWLTMGWNTTWNLRQSSLTEGIDYLRRLNLIEIDSSVSSSSILRQICVPELD